MKGHAILHRVANQAVVVIFLTITLLAIPVSGLPLPSIIQEIVTRMGRNAFLVFSLILPIMAGMGINFGMVLGAMAGQIGLIFAVDWNIVGVPGLIFASLIGVPLAAILGALAGAVLNRARGREMVTGYILGFFYGWLLSTGSTLSDGLSNTCSFSCHYPFSGIWDP